jgi:hypothetical protein
MIKMVQATRRTLNPRFGSLVGRSKLAFVFGFLATAIVFLAVFSWFQRNQFDDARSAEVNLNQIATLTREINNLTWTALQEQNLTPEADAGMRAARQALRKAELAAHLHAHHTSALEGVWPVLDNYIMSAGGQWILIQIGDFDKAGRHQSRDTNRYTGPASIPLSRTPASHGHKSNGDFTLPRSDC